MDLEAGLPEVPHTERRVPGGRDDQRGVAAAGGGGATHVRQLVVVACKRLHLLPCVEVIETAQTVPTRSHQLFPARQEVGGSEGGGVEGAGGIRGVVGTRRGWGKETGRLEYRRGVSENHWRLRGCR